MSDQNDMQSRDERRTRAFNPNEHLMQLKSKDGPKDYLPVQWRLVWFRELCPEGMIETEMIHLDLDRETEEEAYVWNNEKRRSEKTIKHAKGYAVFRATVKDGKGGIATGTKSERAASFPDYIEKAETGAIGRALAALGYGTQFTGDEFVEEHRIVDSPVDRSAAPAEGNGSGRKAIVAVRTVASNGGGSGNGRTGVSAPPTEIGAESTATEQQLVSIRKLCEHLGKAEPEQLDTMSYVSAKELIAQLSQEYRQNRKAS